MFWTQFAVDTLIYGEVKIRKGPSGKVPDISSAGIFRRSVGENKGQIRDWRLLIDTSGRSVHVLEYRDRYESHVDEFDPSIKPLEHLIVDKGKEDLTRYIKEKIWSKK